MTGVLLPFLVADGILLWMLLGCWRRQEVWMGTRMGRKDESPGVWWLSLIRLAGLLLLSLIGTAAVLLG